MHVGPAALRLGCYLAHALRSEDALAPPAPSRAPSPAAGTRGGRGDGALACGSLVLAATILRNETSLALVCTAVAKNGKAAAIGGGAAPVEKEGGRRAEGSAPRSGRGIDLCGGAARPGDDTLVERVEMRPGQR